MSNMIIEKSIRKPHPSPTFEDMPTPFDVISCLMCTTSRTGTVFKVADTAVVAPVSLTLRVNIITAPAKNEYFTKGKIIVLNTAKGLAPSIRAAFSISKSTREIAAERDFTKYG